jgi:hypothetical protein
MTVITEKTSVKIKIMNETPLHLNDKLYRLNSFNSKLLTIGIDKNTPELLKTFDKICDSYLSLMKCFRYDHENSRGKKIYRRYKQWESNFVETVQQARAVIKKLIAGAGDYSLMNVLKNLCGAFAKYRDVARSNITASCTGEFWALVTLI